MFLQKQPDVAGSLRGAIACPFTPLLSSGCGFSLPSSGLCHICCFHERPTKTCDPSSPGTMCHAFIPSAEGGLLSPPLLAQFNTNHCLSVLFKVGPAVLTAFRIHLHPGTGRSEAVCDTRLSVISSYLAACSRFINSDGKGTFFLAFSSFATQSKCLPPEQSPARVQACKPPARFLSDPKHDPCPHPCHHPCPNPSCSSPFKMILSAFKIKASGS